MHQKFKRWLKAVYHQLVEIHDTPHRKALGLALGVFLGIFPGAGPIASLVAAYLLRANKAAALLGSLLTNTWFTVITFTLAVKLGARFSRTDLGTLQTVWNDLIQNFEWSKVHHPEIVNMLLAMVAGFLIISFAAGAAAYLVSYGILIAREKKK